MATWSATCEAELARANAGRPAGTAPITRAMIDAVGEEPRDLRAAGFVCIAAYMDALICERGGPCPSSSGGMLLAVGAVLGAVFLVASRSGGGMRGLKGFRLPGFKRPPREGTRVVFDPNPASMALYSSHPRIGESGTVKPVAMGGGRRAVSMRGPGGGLVYVDWDESRFQGVSLHDLSKGAK